VSNVHGKVKIEWLDTIFKMHESIEKLVDEIAEEYSVSKATAANMLFDWHAVMIKKKMKESEGAE